MKETIMPMVIGSTPARQILVTLVTTMMPPTAAIIT